MSKSKIKEEMARKVKLLDLISDNPGIVSIQLAELTGRAAFSVGVDCKNLISSGLVDNVGRHTHYYKKDGKVTGSLYTPKLSLSMTLSDAKLKLSALFDEKIDRFETQRRAWEETRDRKKYEKEEKDDMEGVTHYAGVIRDCLRLIVATIMTSDCDVHSRKARRTAITWTKWYVD